MPGAPGAALPTQPPPAPRLPVGDRLWQTGDVRQTGQTGRGHVRHGVQGPLQADREPGGPQGDPPGARGGRPLHGHPRGVAAEGPEARQRGHLARHHSHAELPHARLRVPRSGPETVPGRLRQRHQHAQRQAAAGFGLLSPSQSAAPRPETPKPPPQPEGGTEVGRLRVGAGEVDPHQDVLQRGGDAVVPPPRHPAGLHRVLHADRHV
uniref:Uncharacterized protein n=1 Tax=Gallus gallus TaxID=9031 RepID=A0A8V0X274_CHICK